VLCDCEETLDRIYDLKLSRQESRMYLLLKRHEGRIVGVRELIATCRLDGGDDKNNEQAVRVMISRLRAKLRDANVSERIVTARTFGVYLETFDHGDSGVSA
jgi:DNA-binding response OmpR family regulator